MDAIRLTTGWKIKFRVHHLRIVRDGAKALAVVDVSDASRQSDDGGTFELEGLNGQWRTLYVAGVDGGIGDCKTERAILDRMIEKAKEHYAPQEIFPDSFWKLEHNNKSADDCAVSRSFVEPITRPNSADDSK